MLHDRQRDQFINVLQHFRRRIDHRRQAHGSTFALMDNARGRVSYSEPNTIHYMYRGGRASRIRSEARVMRCVATKPKTKIIEQVCVFIPMALFSR